MAEKGHAGFANTDEERRQNTEGGHASHEKGAAHEFSEEGADAGRRSHHAHSSGHTGHTPAGGIEKQGSVSGNMAADSGEGGSETVSAPQRSRGTRGGTHDQHVTAGQKGGSRIRQLIELGYKYEQEHGIGPGQNERSKLAAKRRASKSEGNRQSDEGD